MHSIKKRFIPVIFPLKHPGIFSFHEDHFLIQKNLPFDNIHQGRTQSSTPGYVFQAKMNRLLFSASLQHLLSFQRMETAAA